MCKISAQSVVSSQQAATESAAEEKKKKKKEQKKVGNPIGDPVGGRNAPIIFKNALYSMFGKYFSVLQRFRFEIHALGIDPCVKKP